MSKRWQPYAQHILDGIAKIRRIEGRGDLIQDEILYDATLRNLQRLSETTQQLPAALKLGRRDKLVDIAQFLAAKARQPEVRRGAEAIAGRMRNQRLQ